MVIAGNSDGVFACAKVVFGKAGRERMISHRRPVPAVGLLMAHELETESVTGALEGVEVLDQEIHFSNVAHGDSFSVEDHSLVASRVAAKGGWFALANTLGGLTFPEPVELKTINQFNQVGVRPHARNVMRYA